MKKFVESNVFLIACLLFVAVAFFCEAEFAFLFMLLSTLCAALWNTEVRKQVSGEEN